MLADVRAAPGPIRLSPGEYRVDAGVVVIDVPGVTIHGAGVGSTAIAIQTSGDGIRFGLDGANFDDCGGIEDLSITGGPSRTTGRTIVISGCNGGRMVGVKVDRAAGHGLVFTCAAEHTVLSRCNGNWTVRDVDIWHTGATAGIWIEGDSDRRFERVDIRGDRSTGSRGVLILNTGGDWWGKLAILFEEIGVSFEPPSGRSISFVNFVDAHADSGMDSGWRFASTGGVTRGIDCSLCWAGGNGMPLVNHPQMPPGYGSAAIGFKIRNVDGLTLTSANVWDNGGVGLEVGPGASNVQIIGGWAAANSAAAPGMSPGVLINSAGGVYVGGGFRSGNPVLAPSWHSCGIEISAAADNVTVTGVDLRGNVLTGLCSQAGAGASVIIRDIR